MGLVKWILLRDLGIWLIHMKSCFLNHKCYSAQMFWNSKEVSKHSEVLLNDLIIVEQKAVKWEFFIPKQGTSSLDAVIFFFFFLLILFWGGRIVNES